MSNSESGFHLMVDNEGSSGEHSLKEGDAESGYSSVEWSFSTSELFLGCTFYTWYALKEKQPHKTLVFSSYSFFLHAYKTTCR